MESSAAGLAALALFVLVLGYWVPQRVRQRQQLAESRIEDRFSGSLRVLAVAAGSVPLPVPGVDVPALAGPAPAGLLTMAAGPQPLKVPVHAGRSAREETPMAEPQVTARPSRLELLEERAKRARRRLTITLFLLLATVAVWAAVPLTPLLWFAGIAPTALLVVVLLLGRAAAVRARRADARWAAERRAAERRALQARALAAGGPHAPRNRARVTGRAVRGSSAMTQMIPRVAVTVVEGVAKEVVRAAVSDGGASEHSTADGGEASSSPAPAGAGTPPDAVARPQVPVPGAPWEPRPVPLPTYVTKAAAPRREPLPLSGATPVVSTGWSSSPWQRLEDAGERVGEANTSWSLGATQAAALGQTTTPAPASGSVAASDAAEGGDPLVAEEPRPRTETLGLPLEQILARRRAVG
ncbi:hypothetical protein [Xylanimonas sp. McL0601]|uniref:hypothetical protein n=1 Tax=Xylanimonas sp. McL0601 TaxID=3414739 RepID=UPI003CE7CF74